MKARVLAFVAGAGMSAILCSASELLFEKHKALVGGNGEAPLPAINGYRWREADRKAGRDFGYRAELIIKRLYPETVDYLWDSNFYRVVSDGEVSTAEGVAFSDPDRPVAHFWAMRFVMGQVAYGPELLIYDMDYWDLAEGLLKNRGQMKAGAFRRYRPEDLVPRR
jgi:hypothetical protein